MTDDVTIFDTASGGWDDARMYTQHGERRLELPPRTEVFGIRAALLDAGRLPIAGLRVCDARLDVLRMDSASFIRADGSGFSVPAWLLTALADPNLVIVTGREALRFEADREEAIAAYGRIIWPMEHLPQTEDLRPPLSHAEFGFTFDSRGWRLTLADPKRPLIGTEDEANAIAEYLRFGVLDGCDWTSQTGWSLHREPGGGFDAALSAPPDSAKAPSGMPVNGPIGKAVLALRADGIANAERRQAVRNEIRDLVDRQADSHGNCHPDELVYSLGETLADELISSYPQLLDTER